MKAKIKSLAGIFIPILIGLGLMWYSYDSFTPQQLQQMKAYFVTADYNYVALSLVLAVAGYVLRAYRWKYTLSQIGCQPDFKLNFLAVSIGYFINLSIPRSGEVSRALILKKYQDVPFDKAFGTIIAERIVDLVVLILFILVALVVEYHTLRDLLLYYIPIEKLIILIVIGIAGILLSTYLYFYSNWKLILLLKTKVEGLKEGALSVLRMHDKWPFLIYTFLIWFSYVLMFYATTFALTETDSITIGSVLVAFVIGSLVIAFTNGGFGVFPILIAKILLLYGVPDEAGNAFGWIVWISQLIITVVLGLFAFLVLPLYYKKTNNSLS
ncbi:MAG: lysylphosphatidylglycerol synthase transmembrane domain-containing protein [Flavobacterium sp.]|nr:lysylphosphatidylglycerol synthase transmembrane domain-containing protein [Flavobacterium sp.]